MGKRKVATKMIVQYNGHNFRKAGDLDLNLKTDYSEIVNVLSLFQMLNQNIDVKVKIGQSKPEELGIFSIKNINIDRDGEAKIKFNSETTSVNSEKFLDLMQPDTLIVLQASAEVESEDDDEEDEEEEADE